MISNRTKPVSTLNGVLAINKPSGMTSHDVVQAVRRITHVQRVGHTGTLDPAATGVLVVCLGKATRIVRYLEASDKEYVAGMRLGVTTDTQDAQGRVLETVSYIPPDRETIIRVMRQFCGEIDQQPPAYSAIKISGVPSYKLARLGKAQPHPPRRVTIHSMELISFDDPLITLKVWCSKGVYIRTLCTDMGAVLGTGAHLSSLVRTRAGGFRIENTITLDYLTNLAASGSVEPALISIDSSLQDFPEVAVDENGARKIGCGNAIPAEDNKTHLKNKYLRVHDPAGRLIAIATAAAGLLKPEVVFSDAVS